MGVMKCVTANSRTEIDAHSTIAVFCTSYVRTSSTIPLPVVLLAERIVRHTGDVADDKFFKKQNTSDVTQFEILYPELPSFIAAWLWVRASTRLYRSASKLILVIVTRVTDLLPNRRFCRVHLCRAHCLQGESAVGEQFQQPLADHFTQKTDAQLISQASQFLPT